MAKISGIYVEIRGDSSQLKKELKDAKALVSEQAQGMSKALGGAFSSSQISGGIKKLTSDLATLSSHSRVSATALKNMSVDLGALQRVTGLSADEFGKLQTRLLQTSASRAQEQALRRIATAAGLSTAEIRALGQQMGVSAASIDKVTGASRQAASGLSALGVAGGMIVARLASELALLPKAVLDAGIALDSLTRSFQAIAGSEYGDFIQYLREESERLGQSFYDLAPAFKSISAAARGTALEGEPVRKVFSAIAEASTALGMSSADTEGALRALGQMISKGNVQAEELRGQLGERLPGAFQLASKAMGVTTQQLNKMLKDGDVLATDLLPKLADEIHRAYGAAAETAALESGQAAVNRLSGAWTDFKANLYYSEPAVAGINAITAALKELADEANSLSKIRKDMFWIGETMSSSRFLSADREERLKMLNMAGENSFRGKVNRSDVRTATAPVPAAYVADATGTDKAAKAAAKAHEKMLADGRKAAEAIDAWGVAYEDRRVQAIAATVEARAKAATQERAAIEEMTSWNAYAAKALEDTVSGAFQNMGDALVDFALPGKATFSDFADSVIRDMARIVVQQQIVGPLAGAATDFISGLFAGPSSAAGTGYAGELSRLMAVSAKGNVFESAGLHAYANSIVDRPTVFPFAKGVGLMGEEGPEAIMPLKRGPDGVLGVKGGSNIVINQIEAPGRGGEVQRREENGVSIIDLFVEQIETKVAGSISQGRGPVPAALARTYGLNRSNGALR
jgi:tape measure domain-containing protein